MTKWCQVRYALPISDDPHLPAPGARCALPDGHDGPHMFARAEPLPEAMAAMHLAPPPKSRAELRRDVAFVTDHMLELRAEEAFAQMASTSSAAYQAFRTGYIAGYRARERDEERD